MKTKKHVRSSADVLSHLSHLEVQARCRRDQPSRVKELRAEVAALRAQRDLLKAEIETHKVGSANGVFLRLQDSVHDTKQYRPSPTSYSKSSNNINL